MLLAHKCPSTYILQLFSFIPFYQDLGGEGSTNKTEDLEKQDESDIQVTEDFEGDLEDINDESQQDEISDEDGG